MIKVMHLLDAINLDYFIVINKFNAVPLDEREIMKGRIKQEIVDNNVKLVKNIYFVNALHTEQFPDWSRLVMDLNITNENVTPQAEQKTTDKKDL
ncbi:unnamed protein product [Didymodactylos carnosus]|uniref:Uncharacterized protein n=2 Tax=Didymodactylos carnosus TaxID=1234261 RepID=A0A8S2JKH4_9BILA|nr:unnamed protein product [Didymodactylos carnosus]CAF3803074.1 unnamed protein product [Didymodactylos carnosus]